MKALFIGQSYIDITFVTDHMPSGDEKTVARDYAVSFGGNAVTAAFACAKLGIAPDLLASVADDWLGRMFIDMAAKYGISVHHRKVAESSLSFIMPKGDQRAIVRCRDDNFKHPFPLLNLTGCRALHVDGHLPDERFLPALDVPDRLVIDTNGAGDIFHGSYVYSYLIDPDAEWEQHFKFARAASAHSIQHLGNEASLPTLAQINETAARFGVRRESPVELEVVSDAWSDAKVTRPAALRR
jgi:sugar/nucleoside kinase (ribokinase family)